MRRGDVVIWLVVLFVLILAAGVIGMTAYIWMHSNP
jgi:hypothetical protein